MEERCFGYTKKELEKIFEYYLGTPKIYKYCYENSPEFRAFIDNANDEMKRSIKMMQTGYYGAHCQEPLKHLGTFGLSLIGKKIAEKKEFEKLKQTIEGDEFKTLFKNIGAIFSFLKSNENR